MMWDLKSMNQSSNTSASAIFRLKSYDGVGLDESTNIQIEVMFIVFVYQGVHHCNVT